MKYIFFELIPTFVFSLVGFVFLITMVNTFKLGEYIIVHGAKVGIVVQLVGYMIISFLPVIFPMAILFTVLLTYGRLSQDSEIVAMKSLGLGMRHIATPAILLGTIVTILAAQVSFNLAPWGTRQLDVLVHEMQNYQPMATIREGVFSDGFFDLVVYANKVDSKNGNLKKIFIYDERGGSPLTIIAREGQLINTSHSLKSQAFLRLINGNMHSSTNEFYTKIDFDTYDINLFDQREAGERKWSSDNLSMNELSHELRNKQLTEATRLDYQLEWHRRWTMSIMSVIFALIAAGLGTVTNRRAARASGIVLGISLIVGYWILYAAMENIARKDIMPIFIPLWFVVVASLALGVHFLRRSAKA